MNTHAYSTFALDAYWFANESGDPELQAHVLSCGECRAYLDSLRAGAIEDAMANGVREISSVKKSPWSHRATRALAGLAIAAGLLFVAQRAFVNRDSGYVGTKGAPGVQVLVRHAGATSIWDGTSRVGQGDALAFQLDCEGLAHVTIASRDAHAARFERITEAACPTDRTPLPFTLVVDADPNDDEIAIVMSRLPLDDIALTKAIDHSDASHDAWSSRMVFHKSNAPLQRTP
jgi:hypothetical protein